MHQNQQLQIIIYVPDNDILEQVGDDVGLDVGLRDGSYVGSYV